MKERPILFSGPMVKAILDLRKSQTRRVMKVQPENQPVLCANVTNSGQPSWVSKTQLGSRYELCPYGVPGDRLWVRESGWLDRDEGRFFAYKATPGEAIESTTGSYIATRPEAVNSETMRKCYKPVPSIHMPRWASRLTLEITDVRVQRVQEISFEDAQAEGADVPEVRMMSLFGADEHGRKKIYAIHAELGFKPLWDSINAARGHGWDADPWIWALTFRRIEVRA